MHPLDNPIWHALTTRQSSVAEVCGKAVRFIPDVSPLGGLEDPSEGSFASLGTLLQSGTKVGLFLHELPKLSVGWEIASSGDLLQMIHDGPMVHEPIPDVLRLGDTDAVEMTELAHLTKPGPFHPKTHELGEFFGIRRDGTLAAMAGERLRLPGYTEISAVCTHPQHLGRGYAGWLVSLLIERIRRRSETPFLHVRGDNNRAIALYERLGFKTRLQYHYVVLRRKA